MTALLRRGLRPRWEWLLVGLIVVVGAWSTSLSPYFLDASNLFALTQPAIGMGILALGLMLVVLLGDIDVSGPAIVALSAVLFGELVDGGMDVWVASLAAIAIGTALGTVNGVLVAVARLPALGVTLGTLGAYQAIAYLILGGRAVTDLPESFTNVGIGTIGGTVVTLSFVLFLVVVATIAVLVHRTRFGRVVFALGASPEAARYSGLPVIRVRIACFALAGGLAALGGLVMVAYFATARADIAGTATLLQALTVVTLGGVSVFGGAGTVGGVALAILLLATIQNGMGLANIDGPLQQIAIGLLLVATLATLRLSSLLAAYRVRRESGRRASTTSDAEETRRTS